MLNLPVLANGDNGASVIKLQTQLKNWGCYSGVIDGAFGAQTEAAVEEFQKRRQKDCAYSHKALAVDGVCGASTWAELLATDVKNITSEHVEQIISVATAQHIFRNTPNAAQMDDLNRCMSRASITTKQRKRHFLSQIGHESCGLIYMHEIADGSAYEGRRDLGNTQPGDGRLFRGVGPLQVTGRANYQDIADFTGDERVMEGWQYVERYYPFTAAAVWWLKNSMNSLCDRSDVTVKMVTYRVNGGYNGLADRIAYYNRACDVI